MENQTALSGIEVAIVGLGLIGGSIARDLRGRGACARLLGVDNNAEHAARSLDLGLVDAVLPLDAALETAGLVVIAVPVDAAMHLLPAVLDRVDGRQVVTDVCSTKQKLMEVVRAHPSRHRFVGGHPMAGTEFSGPDAAVEGLFEGKAGILCDTADSAPEAVALVEELYQTLGMRTVQMDAARHDMQVAYVSHVSHAISYALALTVLDKERDETAIFNLASGGFDSTARLAKSGADMWVPIFMSNRDNLLAVLATYREKLEALRGAIEAGDAEAMRALIVAANDIRRVLR
jgi:prephenate dehydrogenase